MGFSCLGGTGLAATQRPSLEELRDRALSLLNADREERGLPPLSEDRPLDQAAQKHAEDMARQNYLAHVSPQGGTVFDRYTAAGGDRWRAVAENIGFCSDCGPELDFGDVRQMEAGWMNSPPHREHILSPGLTRFGYGLAATEGGKLYAVQTFSGPGGREQSSEAIGPSQQVARFLDLLNHDRARRGLPQAQAQRILTKTASGALRNAENPLHASDMLDGIHRALGTNWRSLATVVGVCGGCGTELTGADVETFYTRWMNNPDYRDRLMDPDFTSAGFAMTADGEGRKVALSLLGAPAVTTANR